MPKNMKSRFNQIWLLLFGIVVFSGGWFVAFAANIPLHEEKLETVVNSIGTEHCLPSISGTPIAAPTETVVPIRPQMAVSGTVFDDKRCSYLPIVLVEDTSAATLVPTITPAPTETIVP